MRLESWDEAVKRAKAEAEAAAREEAQASQVVPPPLPAEARSESVTGPPRPKARTKVLILIPALAVGLVSLWFWFAGFSRGYDPKRRHPEMPDYAAKFLMVALRENDRLPEQESKDYEPLAEAQKSSREFYEDIAATMPPDFESERLLVEAASYFKGDVFDVWIGCRSASPELYREGTKPMDIVEGLVETMRSTGRKGFDKRLIRRFVVVYDMLRREERVSHREAISDLTRRVKAYGDF
jgi:hypothetical protein